MMSVYFAESARWDSNPSDTCCSQYLQIARHPSRGCNSSQLPNANTMTSKVFLCILLVILLVPCSSASTCFSDPESILVRLKTLVFGEFLVLNDLSPSYFSINQTLGCSCLMLLLIFTTAEPPSSKGTPYGDGWVSVLCSSR